MSMAIRTALSQRSQSKARTTGRRPSTNGAIGTRRLRLDRPFSITDSGGAKVDLNAEEALGAILDWHRDVYFGASGDRWQSAEPLTIGAVIKGEGVDLTAPINDDMHRVLHAVTSWPEDWRHADLPVLKDYCLRVSMKNSSIGDALYAVGRGRTLWRPALFSLKSAPKPLHKLSCLAHNMLAGAVQAESLRLFALGLDASDPAAQKKILSTDFVDTAANLLHRMRLGMKTYRSTSIQRVHRRPGQQDRGQCAPRARQRTTADRLGSLPQATPTQSPLIARVFARRAR